MKAVWRSPNAASYGSFAMKKNSMFTTFFSNAVLELKENGQFIILQNDNERSQAPSNCQTLPLFTNIKAASGFEKLAFLFVILIIGILLSFLVVMVEKMKSSMKMITDNEKRSKKIALIEVSLRKTLDELLAEEKEKCLINLLEELT